MAERPLRICVLSDGEPGHYNQSRGIVQALRLLGPVDDSWLDVRLRVGLARTPLRSVLNRNQAPRSLWPLRLAYRIDELPDVGYDLIVSAGGRTSFANAWLAAVLEVPNVYAGSLRGLSPGLFSVVLTLEPVPGAASNLVLSLPPSAIDADQVEPLGHGFRLQLDGPDQRYWTLLLGGDGAGYRYARGDWLSLARLINTLARWRDIRWLLVSSRRTGRRAESLLRKHVDATCVARACWYQGGDEYRAEAWLGAAERIFVTEDSMTMLAEAACARRPVHSLCAASAAPDQRYEKALQRFAAQGWLCRHPIAELADKPETLDAQRCRALAASPTQWLAEQLRQRLGLG